MKNNKINILIGCEESQAVCIEFRKAGFNAFSCDILPCSGNRPEWHIQADVFEIIPEHYLCKCGYRFSAECGKYGCPNCGGEFVAKLFNWDAAVFFPPCTDLAVSGAAHFKRKQADGTQQKSIEFFLKIANAPIKYKAIENPIGIMNNFYRKPDQIIQPYYFGDEAQKTTCLWLYNLPPLFHAKEPDLFNSEITHVNKGDFFYWFNKKTVKTDKQPLWYAQAKGFGGKAPNKNFNKTRSKTFPGIAAAMAKQWGEYLKNQFKTVTP